MKRDEFMMQLHRELDGVRVSPALRQQTIAAAQGKGEPIVKRKMTFALAAALMAVLLCAAALAAAVFTAYRGKSLLTVALVSSAAVLVTEGLLTLLGAAL